MSLHRNFSRIVAWQKHNFHPSSPQGALKLQYKIVGNLHRPRDTRRDPQEQLVFNNNDRIQQLCHPIFASSNQTSISYWQYRHISTLKKFYIYFSFFFISQGTVRSTVLLCIILTWLHYSSTPWQLG